VKPQRCADEQESATSPSGIDKLTQSKPVFGLALFGMHGASLLRGFFVASNM
jgi:hypothetical protein